MTLNHPIAHASPLQQPIQSQPAPDELTQWIALAGIVALVVLGVILVLRERAAGTDASPSTRAIPDDEVLTDRERVSALLEDNGGRMKQSAIVDSVEWSKAKVSRLLADLESDGKITKLRLGRENLICLQGHEPSVSKSRSQSQPGSRSRSQSPPTGGDSSTRSRSQEDAQSPSHSHSHPHPQSPTDQSNDSSNSLE